MGNQLGQHGSRTFHGTESSPGQHCSRESWSENRHSITRAMSHELLQGKMGGRMNDERCVCSRGGEDETQTSLWGASLLHSPLGTRVPVLTELNVSCRKQALTS